MKAKQLPLDWNKPTKPEVPQEQPASDEDEWEFPGELFDDALPPHVLKLVNELIWACWITEGVGSAHELLIEDVQKSIDRWGTFANKRIVEKLQHEQ